MRFFFDGSEGQDDGKDSWLTLAGFVASDAFWDAFEKKWALMLRERYPVAPFIHMWEMVSGVDPFERVAGWTQDKINQLVSDAVDLLQKLDKKSFCSFVCSVNTSARSRLVASGSVIPEPEIICGRWCLVRASEWYFEAHPLKIERMTVFFDRGENFMGPLKKLWLTERTPPERVARNLFWDLIQNIIDIDMVDTPGIQAADMLAWSRSRGLSEKDRVHRDLLNIIQHVVPNWNLVLDENNLRQAHPPKV